jgi:hypothetical protein
LLSGDRENPDGAGKFAVEPESGKIRTGQGKSMFRDRENPDGGAVKIAV